MKRKTEFSKKILMVVGAVTVIVTAFTLLMIWITRDLSPLMYLIPALFTELGVGTAFYYNKAKVENQIKLKKENPELFEERIDFNDTENYQ